MPIFDTHAHYDADRFDSDRDALLSAMPAVSYTHLTLPTKA